MSSLGRTLVALTTLALVSSAEEPEPKIDVKEEARQFVESKSGFTRQFEIRGEKFTYSFDKQDYLDDVVTPSINKWNTAKRSIESIKPYQDLVDKIKGNANNTNQKIAFIFNFLANENNFSYFPDEELPYTKDGEEEYVKTALMTIAEGAGDCDDYTVAAYTLGEMMSLDFHIVNYDPIKNENEDHTMIDYIIGSIMGKDFDIEYDPQDEDEEAHYTISEIMGLDFNIEYDPKKDNHTIVDYMIGKTMGLDFRIVEDESGHLALAYPVDACLYNEKDKNLEFRGVSCVERGNKFADPEHHFILLEPQNPYPIANFVAADPDEKYIRCITDPKEGEIYKVANKWNYNTNEIPKLGKNSK